MSNAVALRKPSAFELELAEYQPQLVAALPSHIPVDRFKRVVITAVNRNPDLAKADRRSFFTSCVQAAQDGLLPDGREAALVIFNTKNHKTGEWVKQVQYMPMVAGIIKRMRNSGDVAAVDAQLVHQKDEFVYQLGDDPRIVHKPELLNRGEPIAAYAIIKLTNGEVLREVMGREDIEKVRQVSRAKDKGPWVDWWGEMARKTVLRRCAKRAPVSSDLDELLKRDDDMLKRAPAQISIAAERPTRAQFHDEPTNEPGPDQLEPFVVIDGDGEPNEFDDPGEAAAALTEMLDQAATRAALEGIWESNTLSGQLRDRGHVTTADALQEAYVAADKAFSAQAPDPMPPSPLAAKKGAVDGAWIAWERAASQRIEAMPQAEIAGFLSEHGTVFDEMAKLRPSSWQAIEALIERKKDAA